MLLPTMKIERQSSKKVGNIFFGRADGNVDGRGDGGKDDRGPSFNIKNPACNFLLCCAKIEP
jgi:hypothetical protein